MTSSISSPNSLRTSRWRTITDKAQGFCRDRAQGRCGESASSFWEKRAHAEDHGSGNRQGASDMFSQCSRRSRVNSTDPSSVADTNGDRADCESDRQSDPNEDRQLAFEARGLHRTSEIHRNTAPAMRQTLLPYRSLRISRRLPSVVARSIVMISRQRGDGASCRGMRSCPR